MTRPRHLIHLCRPLLSTTPRPSTTLHLHHLSPSHPHSHPRPLPRQLHHTPSHRTTAIPPNPQATITHPTPLLHRTGPHHPLPPLSHLRPSRRWLRTLPLFLAVVTASAFGLFNYQRLNSPVIAATLYALRTDGRVREVLGDEVYFADKALAWVGGEINLVQGRIDVWFDVAGRWRRGEGGGEERRRGRCRFRARRVGGRNGEFKTLEWSLTPQGAETIQLLDERGPHPLQGASL